ncbi:MAG: DUF4416 family protein [Chitinispirillaceae bacterium]|nr:DUF4416 family protein [Chitinispirillaceae bacterium]
MGTETTPHNVQLFIALLYSPDAPVKAVLDELDRWHGTRDHAYGPVPFSWSAYYNDEMGSNLQKMYFSYRDSIDRDLLPSIKLRTNAIEREYAGPDGNRIINIDPGYIARDKVVLATTKDFFHRLHLANGIYGEVTLHYRKGRFRYFSWTYPDFRDPEIMRFLERIRAPLVRQIRHATS